jgi:hypothetical protein
MKKLNYSYLLIGSGRLARHLEFYLTQLEIPFSTWNRKEEIKDLENLISSSSHILLAISDSALQNFVEAYLKGLNKAIVTFSGALQIDGAISAHPLMSFGPELYSFEDYKKIHFVITGAERLNEILPGFENPFSVIKPEEKPLYHAMCVLGGNFPLLLWHQMAEGFRKMGLPKEAHKIYLEKITENFNRNGIKALTGPLVRRDLETIQKNLKALDGNPYKNVYAAFVEAYK